MASDKQKSTHSEHSAYTQKPARQNASHSLSESDMRTRQQAVDFAEASVSLSGFKIAEGMKLLGQRYISGEIDLDEFLAGSTDAVLGRDQINR